MAESFAPSTGAIMGSPVGFGQRAFPILNDCARDVDIRHCIR
jgi:hypothetical protein